ncbi:hypothetical protein ACHAXH_000251 [Discostella pseudostelligera]
MEENELEMKRYLSSVCRGRVVAAVLSIMLHYKFPILPPVAAAAAEHIIATSSSKQASETRRGGTGVAVLHNNKW